MVDNRVIKLTITDSNGKDSSMWFNYDEWLYNQDWLEWKEKTFRSNEKDLSDEWQFLQWRKRIYNR